MKITRRLCISVICLVLSLAFCVWAVFAWFTNNNQVRGEGISSSVLGPELVGLEVERYSLERQKNGSYAVKEKIPDTEATMPRFNDDEVGTTAVLIKVTLTVSGDNVSCTLTIDCLSSEVTVSEGAISGIYNSALSNAVLLYDVEGQVTEENGVPTSVTVAEGATAMRFWNGSVAGGQPQGKTDKIALRNNWAPAAGSTSVSLYLFMDYDSALITDGLYPLVDNSFSSSMDFDTDISFTATQIEVEG